MKKCKHIRTKIVVVNGSTCDRPGEFCDCSPTRRVVKCVDCGAIVGAQG